MAFNTPYSSPYQMYTPNVYQPPTPQNQANSGIIWVSGLAGAKSFLVAPNSSVVLFDSESQTVYLKSADATGLPSMRILDYTIRDQKPHSGVFTQQSDYATKQEIDDLRAELEQLKTSMKGAANEPTLRTDAKQQSK